MSSRFLSRLREVYDEWEARLQRCDPAADDAPPLSLAAVLTLAVATIASAWTFLRAPFPPLQDLWHHAAMIAIVTDYGHAGSIYPDLYTPFDWLSSNSLLYGVGALVAKVIGVMAAVKLLVALAYFVGVPWALLYALRVFRRDAWCAVLAVPLTYNRLIVFGFANMLFAAPLFILSLPLFWRAITEPSRKHTLAAGALFCFLFLGHGHLFLWAGVLAFLMTLGLTWHRFDDDEKPLRDRAIASGRTALVAFVTVLPSLILFGAWTKRAFFGASQMLGADADPSHLEADYPSLEYRFSTLFSRGVIATKDWREYIVWAAIFVLFALALTFASNLPKKPRGVPILELATIATIIGALALPENLETHEVIASRNVGIAAWLAPVFAEPLAALVSVGLREVVIMLVCLVTVASQYVYRDCEDAMRVETAGLREVLDAMPPRLRLHMVKLDTNSAYFPERALWHVEKIYMAEKFGTTPDTPALLATGAVHVKPGVNPHWIHRHNPFWPLDDEIWKNFDLVLVRRWFPTPELTRLAEQHATLLKRSGDWEVWQTKR